MCLVSDFNVDYRALENGAEAKGASGAHLLRSVQNEERANRLLFVV